MGGMDLSPNRVAVYLTAGAALVGALAPAVANLDVSSTAGIIAGLVTAATVVHKWLDGWQQYEARSHDYGEHDFDEADHEGEW